MRTLDPTRVQRAANGTLTSLLQRYGDRTKLRGKRQSQIARDAWLDESYLSRLFSGERENPSRDALILLSAFGMGLAVEEVDEVLMAADYKPLVLPASLR
jgi:transcriptional regulator with XRE-family HTH domain